MIARSVSVRVLAVGLFLLPTLSGLPARAQDGNTFVIGSSEGYGIGECFQSGASCGKVVADTWCESQGRGKALAFGLASDVTASIESAASKSGASDPGAVIITCGR